MGTDKGYTDTLKCSTINKKIILKNIKALFMHKNPVMENANITQNMLIGFMLKETLGKDYDTIRHEHN